MNTELKYLNEASDEYMNEIFDSIFKASTFTPKQKNIINLMRSILERIFSGSSLKMFTERYDVKKDLLDDILFENNHFLFRWDALRNRFKITIYKDLSKEEKSTIYFNIKDFGKILHDDFFKKGSSVEFRLGASF